MAFKASFDPKTGRVKALVRLSYFNGFRKTASVEGGKLKYRTNGLFYKKTPEGKDTLAVINKAIAALVEKEWPGKNPEKLLNTFDSKRVPVLDGDKNVDDEGNIKEHFEDTFYIKLTNDKKFKYKNRAGEEVDEEERDELFVSGHWAVAYFHLYAVKSKDKGGNAIFTTLDGLQYFKKDEQFVGGGMDDEEFDDYGDEDDDSSSSSKKGSSIDDDDDL